MSVFRNHAERLEAFRRCSIYPVVSPGFCAGRSIPDVVRAIADGGAGIVQLRLKDASGLEYFRLAEICRKITADAGMLLLIDDRLDVALACGADGVHLGQDDLPISEARRIAPDLLIGASTHNPEEIEAAQRDGTSYLNIGPVYPTATKSVACGSLGLDAVERYSKQVRCPWSVMGGIKRRHLPELIAAGARHIAMVTEITAAPDVAAKVRELISACRSLRQADAS